MLEILAFSSSAPHEKLALMSIHEAIKARRKAIGMSMQGLADAVSGLEGLTKKLGWQTVQQWEKGVSAPKRTRLAHVATALKTTVTELLGDGDVATAEDTEAASDGDVTILQYDSGGGMGRSRLLLADQPGVIKSWHVDHEWLRRNVKHYTSINNLRIVTGFGPSMRPMFNPGDPLLLDIGVTHIDHEGVFFFRIGDEGFIKTVQRIPQPNGGRLLLIRSRNQEEFSDFMVDEKTMDFHVLGKILTVWKSEQY